MLLSDFCDDQSDIMNRLIYNNETVDIGDGISFRISDTKSKKDGEYYVFANIEFEFFLDGLSVGTLDHEFCGNIRGCDRDDYRLMDAICYKMQELFPTVWKKIFE